MLILMELKIQSERRELRNQKELQMIKNSIDTDCRYRERERERESERDGQREKEGVDSTKCKDTNRWKNKEPKRPTQKACAKITKR